jgi:hypothetical protein
MAVREKLTRLRCPSRDRNQGQELRPWALRKKGIMSFFKMGGLNFPNYWRDLPFLLGKYFSNLANHKISQVKIIKLLEML